MTRLDLVHEHPRFAALCSLTEESLPPPVLRGPNALLSSSDQFLPQEPTEEEAAELPKSWAEVPDAPAEPPRYHKETPKTCEDVKVTRKVTKCRCDFAF